MTRFLSTCVLALVVSLTFSCSNQEPSNEDNTGNQSGIRDSSAALISVDGFSGPEAVRYDPAQDVYFISNFNGDGGERDSNGFISKVSFDGTIDSLRFMVGTETHPLHAPRGMYITGDTLWAADADGVHGFNRTSGEQLAFIDFTSFEPGFLNDIVQGTDGNLYVTDTGKSVMFKISGGEPSMAVDSLPHPPNGITLNPENNSLVLAPWGGGKTFHSMMENQEELDEFASVSTGGNFDGIEFVNGKLLAASQQDSSIYSIQSDTAGVIIKVPGRPADIGIDTKRMRIAVPYIALNRVDIWEL